MSLVIRASPGGARIGMIAYRVGAQQVVVTVAPKFWRDGTSRVTKLELDPSTSHHHVTLYETDGLVVDGSEESAFVELLETLRSTEEYVNWNNSILGPDVVSQSTAINASAADHADATTDLLLLLQRLSRTALRSEPVTTLPKRSPLHRPLLYRRFIDDVEVLARSTRAGYVQRNERRTAVRGRVDVNSLMVASATGSPSVMCSYDELSRATPLTTVIVTALEWIAEGRGSLSPYQGSLGTQGLREAALAVRRGFEDVPAADPAVASATGRALRLSRVDMPWGSALADAVAILSERDPVPADSKSSTIEPFELSFDTDQLWEQIVDAVLRMAGFDQVRKQGQYASHLNEAPWKSATSGGTVTQPDNLAWASGDLWIFDAKYKAPKAPFRPSRDDQYQMFAYSHLVQDPANPVRVVVLAYPQLKEEQVWARGRDSTAPPVQLFSVGLRFPSASDVKSAYTWTRYLEVLADHVRELRAHAATVLTGTTSI